MFEYQILKRQPSIYKDIFEFQEIGDIEENLFYQASVKGNNFIDNNFIFTMLEPGLDRMEKFLDITNTANMTIEERRIQLYTLWNSFLPLTYRYLINALDQILGEGNYTLYKDFEHYNMTIAVTKGDVNNVVLLFKQIIPMNLTWTVYFDTPREFDTIEYISMGYLRDIEKYFDVFYARAKDFGTNKYYIGIQYMRDNLKHYDFSYTRGKEFGNDIQYVGSNYVKETSRRFN